MRSSSAPRPFSGARTICMGPTRMIPRERRRPGNASTSSSARCRLSADRSALPWRLAVPMGRSSSPSGSIEPVLPLHVRNKRLRVVESNGNAGCGLTQSDEVVCDWDFAGGSPAGDSAMLEACWTSHCLYPLQEPFRTVSFGFFYVCGLDVRGYAHCWGRFNGLGELGRGWRTDERDAAMNYPAPVAGGLRFESLSAGETTSAP